MNGEDWEDIKTNREKTQNNINKMMTMIIRPPGTVVPDGLLFHRRCFLGSHITEVPRPITAKLCHVIGIWLKRSRKLQKIGSLP